MNTLTGLMAAAVVAMTLYQHAAANTRYPENPPVNYKPRGCPEYPQPCYWQRPPHDPEHHWQWNTRP